MRVTMMTSTEEYQDYYEEVQRALELMISVNETIHYMLDDDADRITQADTDKLKAFNRVMGVLVKTLN